MTRFLLLVFYLFSMLMLLTATVIQLESAAPGGQLFITAAAEPNSQAHGRTVTFHGIAGHMAALALATLMCGIARRKGFGLMRLFELVLGLALLVLIGVTIYVIVSGIYSANLDEGPLFFWPLSPAMLNLGTGDFEFVPKALEFLSFSALLVGAAGLLGAALGTRRWAVILILAALVPFVASLFVLRSSAGAQGILAWLYLIPMAGLIGVASVRLIDADLPWLMTLALGTLSGPVLLFFMTLQANWFLTIGIEYIAMSHIMIVPVFLSYAAAILLYPRTRLPAWIGWVAPGAIACVSALVFVPLFALGQDGQVPRSIDYPDVLSRGNMIATAASLLLVAVTLALLIALRRSRA